MLFATTLFSLLTWSATFNLERTILLDQDDAEFARRRLSMSMAADGSFFLKEGARIFHWDTGGNLLNKIHLVGEKRVGIGDVYYDLQSQTYWITEGVSSRTWVYDRRGRLVAKTPQPEAEADNEVTYVRHFLETNGRLFGVHDRAVDLWTATDTPILVELTPTLNADTGQAHLRRASTPFFKLKEIQSQTEFNWKLHFAILQQDKLLVINEMSPIIYCFQVKQSGPLRQYKALSQAFSTALPGYVPPKHREDTIIKNQASFLAWWYSWSRINGFYAWDDDYLVGYEIPNPKNAQRPLQVVQAVNRKGSASGPAMKHNGQLIGVRDGRLFFLSQAADESYYVSVYRLSP